VRWSHRSCKSPIAHSGAKLTASKASVSAPEVPVVRPPTKADRASRDCFVPIPEVDLWARREKVRAGQQHRSPLSASSSYRPSSGPGKVQVGTPTPRFAAPPYPTRASQGCNEIMRTVQSGFIRSYPRGSARRCLPCKRRTRQLERLKLRLPPLLVGRRLLQEGSLNRQMVELTRLPISTKPTIQMTRADYSRPVWPLGKSYLRPVKRRSVTFSLT